jgi:hypothetical protein
VTYEDPVSSALDAPVRSRQGIAAASADVVTSEGVNALPVAVNTDITTLSIVGAVSGAARHLWPCAQQCMHPRPVRPLTSPPSPLPSCPAPVLPPCLSRLPRWR